MSSKLLIDARRLAKKWAPRLFLSHRAIFIEERVAEHEAAAMTYTNPALTSISVAINPQMNWADSAKNHGEDVDPPTDLEETVVHELLHGHTSEVFNAIDKAKEKEGDYWWWRTRQDMEKFVDEVARMMVRLDRGQKG